MAMKKVEEKNKKNVSMKNKNNEKVVEAVIEEEKIICEGCGKKHLSSLSECPNCGYSSLSNNKTKTFYDDEDDFVDYDDEDDEEFVSRKTEKKIKVEVEEEVVVKKVEKKESKKEEKNNKAVKKEEKTVNKKVSVENKKSMLKDDNNEIVSFIKIVVVIILLVGIVWIVASLLNKESDDKKDKEEEVVATIQNDKILGSSIFKKQDKTYYVFVYNANEDNNFVDYYSTLFSEYDVIDDEDKLPMFWVDLNDPLNKDIVAEKADDVNAKPSKYEELSVYNLALIRIKNGKLDKYYDGDYAIDKLTRLIESFRETEEE